MKRRPRWIRKSRRRRIPAAKGRRGKRGKAECECACASSPFPIPVAPPSSAFRTQWPKQLCGRKSVAARRRRLGGSRPVPRSSDGHPQEVGLEEGPGQGGCPRPTTFEGLWEGREVGWRNDCRLFARTRDLENARRCAAL
jgi:hypothetical protein